MYGTMSLTRTNMYNSREVPLKEQLMCMKTMPLIRTYMHNSREVPLRRQPMCMKDYASD